MERSPDHQSEEDRPQQSGSVTSSALFAYQSTSNITLDEEVSKPITLGHWYRILRNTNCPFCRHVVTSLRDNDHDQSIMLHSEVKLSNDQSWKLGIEPSPYDHTKSESYSNRFDLRSKAKHIDPIAYRLVV